MITEVSRKFNEAVDELRQYETGHQLRDRLIADGVTGVPGECDACPVAVWLVQQLNVQPERVTVDQESCQLWTFNGGDWLLDAERLSPASVRQFINAFDGLTVDVDPSYYDTNDELRPYLPLLRRSTNDDADG